MGRSLHRRSASVSPARSLPWKKPKTNASTGLTSSDDSQDFLSSKEQVTDKEEVHFNFKGQGSGAKNTGDNPRKNHCQPLANKNLKKVASLNSFISTLRRGKPDTRGAALISWWNRTGQTKKANKMKRGWLKKSEKQTGPTGRPLCKCKPGTLALREICFYQRSQVFLIPMCAFQRVVHEVTNDIAHGDLRWQSSAFIIYNLQLKCTWWALWGTATFVRALHRKCFTIFPKDLFLVHRLRGHSETGVGAQMSDQASFY